MKEIMNSLDDIEQSIFVTDGIQVSLHGPIVGYPDYWVNKFNRSETVAEFKTRFSKRYQMVDITVFDGLGRIAHGNYLFGNLRATYEFKRIKSVHAETVEMFNVCVEMLVDSEKKVSSLKKELKQIQKNNSALHEISDPYALLGINRDLSDEGVKDAYKRLISRLHPDKISFMDESLVRFANERVQLINQANDEIARLRAGI